MRNFEYFERTSGLQTGLFSLRETLWMEIRSFSSYFTWLEPEHFVRILAAGRQREKCSAAAPTAVATSSAAAPTAVATSSAAAPTEVMRPPDQAPQPPPAYVAPDREAVKCPNGPAVNFAFSPRPAD